MSSSSTPTTDPTPLSDDDTFEVIDDALSELARRRGLWLGDEHALIHILASLIEQAERCLPDSVGTARDNGATWDQIAQLLGTSPHEARLRFDPDSPIVKLSVAQQTMPPTGFPSNIAHLVSVRRAFGAPLRVYLAGVGVLRKPHGESLSRQSLPRPSDTRAAESSRRARRAHDSVTGSLAVLEPVAGR